MCHDPICFGPSLSHPCIEATKPSLYEFLLRELELRAEAVTDFLFLGSKITADGDCSLEIRR